MDVHNAVAIERMRHMRRYLPTHSGINAFGTCTLVPVFWRTAMKPWFVAWACAAALLFLCHLYRAWRSPVDKAMNAPARTVRLHMLVGAGIVGCGWGAAAFWLFPQSQMTQQIVFLLVWAAWASSVIHHCVAYFPACLYALFPFTASMVAVIVMRQTALGFWAAVALMSYTAVLLSIGCRLNRTFVESAVARSRQTERVRRLTFKKEAAEAASMDRSRHLAAANHDLRQSIHAINVYLETLAGLNLPPPANELSKRAYQCGQAIDEMFRALLYVSLLDASAVQPEIGVFPIAAVLERIRLQFEAEARAKGLDLRVTSSSAFVRSDITMVERILANLVKNAIRYTQRGKILVGCKRHGVHWRLAVYDTGPGIPPEKHRKIFEEFFRLDDNERGGDAFGLGLAIVERLARLMSVPVTLRSTPGRGSMFAIDLARGQPEDASLMNTSVAISASRLTETARLS